MESIESMEAMDTIETMKAIETKPCKLWIYAVRLSKLLASRSEHRQIWDAPIASFTLSFFRVFVVQGIAFAYSTFKMRTCPILQWTHCPNYPTQKASKHRYKYDFLDSTPTCATKFNCFPLGLFHIHDQLAHQCRKVLQGAAASRD